MLLFLMRDRFVDVRQTLTLAVSFLGKRVVLLFRLLLLLSLTSACHVTIPHPIIVVVVRVIRAVNYDYFRNRLIDANNRL